MTQISIFAESMSPNRKNVFPKYWIKPNYLKQKTSTKITGKTEFLCVSNENKNFDPIVSRGQELNPQNHCIYLNIEINS